MQMWSVQEAAEQFGVSEQRVRAMVRSGRLSGSRVGKRWVIDAGVDPLRRSHPGRPLGAPNAWALLALLNGDAPDWVHPSVRSRLRRRSRDLDWLEAALIHGEPRARIHRWRVLPRDLGKLQGAVPLIFSGLSVDDLELDVVPDPRQIDAYVAARSLGNIERRFRPEKSSSDPNVLLRVPSHNWVLKHEQQAPLAVVAADLLRDDDPRVARAARHLLRRVASG